MNKQEIRHKHLSLEDLLALHFFTDEKQELLREARTHFSARDLNRLQRGLSCPVCRRALENLRNDARGRTNRVYANRACANEADETARKALGFQRINLPTSPVRRAIFLPAKVALIFLLIFLIIQPDLTTLPPGESSRTARRNGSETETHDSLAKGRIFPLRRGGKIMGRLDLEPHSVLSVNGVKPRGRASLRLELLDGEAEVRVTDVRLLNSLLLSVPGYETTLRLKGSRYAVPPRVTFLISDPDRNSPRLYVLEGKIKLEANSPDGLLVKAGEDVPLGKIY